MEMALIENIQREDLNPLETAEALSRLSTDFNLTQETLSQRVGKDRATVANYLRILKLPGEIKSLINDNSLSLGHAKALLAIEGAQRQIAAAREVTKRGLSVRETEALCKKLSAPSQTKAKKKQDKLPEVAELENKLTQSLGTKVKIHNKDNRGTIEIEYYSLDELDRLLEVLMQQ